MRQRTRTSWEFIGAMVLLYFALFIAFDAFAGGNDQKQYQDQSQRQYQDQSQKQYQDQSQLATAAVDVATTFNEAERPDDITIRNTASGRAPSVYPSGNCYMGWSIGLGAPGANLGFGKAKLDSNCDARETARMFYQFGERSKAIQILCMQPAAAMLEGCKPSQDYNKEMATLKSTNEMLFEDNAKLSDTIKSYCDESNERVFAACIKK